MKMKRWLCQDHAHYLLRDECHEIHLGVCQFEWNVDTPYPNFAGILGRHQFTNFNFLIDCFELIVIKMWHLSISGWPKGIPQRSLSVLVNKLQPHIGVASYCLSKYYKRERKCKFDVQQEIQLYVQQHYQTFCGESPPSSLYPSSILVGGNTCIWAK